MTDEDDVIVMICIRADSKVIPVAGSMVTECVQCHTGLWISQESLFEMPTALAMCVECVMPKLDNDEAEYPQGELAEHIIKEIKAGRFDPNE